MKRVYIDLGGEYDLMDDREYDLLKEAVVTGEIPGASAVSLNEMGFGDRRVPIDVACSNASDGSFIVRVKKCLRMTIHVTTDSGRRFALTQRLVGFVKRQSPLLILGKATCAICGYKTTRQQDQEWQRGQMTGHQTQHPDCHDNQQSGRELHDKEDHRDQHNHHHNYKWKSDGKQHSSSRAGD